MAGSCIVPFLVAPARDWPVMLFVGGFPAVSILVFALISVRFQLSSNANRMWMASYMVIAFVTFGLSILILYAIEDSGFRILSYSAGFASLAVLSAVISNFTWSKPGKDD